MVVKLICIDVDGTLVGTGGRIAARVWPAMEAARATGIRLAMCSGRPAFGTTRDYALRIDAEGWHAFQNGASILRPATGESRSAAIPPAVIADLEERARRTGRILEIYGDGAYAVESRDERARRHAALLGVPFEPGPFGALAGPIVRAQWIVAHDEVDALLAEPHEGLTVAPSTSPIMADTTFVNLTAAGVDKASGIRALARIHGCSLAEVMFVGDGLNDLEAMRIVGIPVAMANADPAVLAIAKHRVAHVDAGGLADALALAD